MQGWKMDTMKSLLKGLARGKFQTIFNTLEDKEKQKHGEEGTESDPLCDEMYNKTLQ